MMSHRRFCCSRSNLPSRPRPEQLPHDSSQEYRKMLTMQRDPIKISWDELSSDKVEAKLKRLDAINKAREQFDKPVAEPMRQSSRFTWFYNTLVYMSLFGALGG